MVYLIFTLAFFVLQEIPFKGKEEFEVKLDYQFKQRPLPDLNTVDLGRVHDPRGASTVLPYLILNIKIRELEGEKMRLRITNNREDRTAQRRVSAGQVIELDLGFTDDMKDRVTAHKHTLTFIDEHKTPVNRIVIEVQEDGTFLVNGENRGKF